MDQEEQFDMGIQTDTKCVDRLDQKAKKQIELKKGVEGSVDEDSQFN